MLSPLLSPSTLRTASTSTVLTIALYDKKFSEGDLSSENHAFSSSQRIFLCTMDEYDGPPKRRKSCLFGPNRKPSPSLRVEPPADLRATLQSSLQTILQLKLLFEMESKLSIFNGLRKLSEFRKIWFYDQAHLLSLKTTINNRQFMVSPLSPGGDGCSKCYTNSVLAVLAVTILQDTTTPLQ